MMAPPVGAEPLVDDDAYLLASRAVLRVGGAGSAVALQAIITNTVPANVRSVVYAAMLGPDGSVAADMFILDDDGEFLIDCDRTHAAAIIARLEESAAGEVRIADETSRWRVFGQFNNQSVFDDGTPYIRFADPRRHEMGSRVLRPSAGRESVSWQHEGKWRGHAYRLGIATGADTFGRVSVGPLEANLHVLNGLDLNFVAPSVAAALAGRQPSTARRILPFRIEPSSFVIPPMIGEPIACGALCIGTVVTVQKLFGLGLIDLEPWRQALRQGISPRCCGETLIVKWPTWLGRESGGRLSPAAAEGGVFQSFETEK